MIGGDKMKKYIHSKAIKNIQNNVRNNQNTDRGIFDRGSYCRTGKTVMYGARRSHRANRSYHSSVRKSIESAGTTPIDIILMAGIGSDKEKEGDKK